MLWGDERFRKFLTRRRQVLDRLRATGKELDGWLEENEPDGNVVELAWLEGVLQVRRGLLSELATLDDRVLDLLIEIRAAGGSGGSNTANR